MAVDRNQVQQAIEAGNGILRLAPSWVPRSFMIPGRRLKLHPDDIYAFGGARGGINERWFSSTTKAANGPDTTEFEGLSFVVTKSGEKFLLKDAVEAAGELLLGKDVFDREKGWNILCKFFDNEGPIPHHMHQNDEHAGAVGFKGKPEAYYFPPQYNQTFNNYPYTFMGLEPGTTKDQIRECLKKWDQGDNGITFLSRAYRLEPGAGWQINPGVLHAPGSLCTYEPQVNSDVFGMFQSEVEGRIVPWELLVKDVPEDKKHDHEYILEMLDWDANTDPHFGANNKVFPIIASEADGYVEKWVVYGTKFYSAKETHGEAGRNRHHQGCGGLRPDRGAGLRRLWWHTSFDPVDDSLRRSDGGRAFCDGRRRAEGRRDQEPQHDRSACHPEALWPRQS